MCRTIFRALLVAAILQMTAALRCLEGADCIRDASCDECEGVACTRITSYNTEDNKEVALTCLPHETRTGFHIREIHLEEAGCRHLGDRQICVCYEDYCNSHIILTMTMPIIVTILTMFVLL